MLPLLLVNSAKQKKSTNCQQRMTAYIYTVYSRRVMYQKKKTLRTEGVDAHIYTQNEKIALLLFVFFYNHFFFHFNTQHVQTQ